MAKTVIKSGETSRPAKKSSPGGQILAVLVVTILAAASGGGSAFYLVKNLKTLSQGAGTAPPIIAGSPGVELASVPVPVVVANLVEPAGVFVRLETELIMDSKAAATAGPLSVEISGDFLNFMRTLSFVDFEGASGFDQLKEDLTDRAQIRSKGLVHEVVIKGLVVK